MKLFCSADFYGRRPGHTAVHDFTPGEVERIVYALQAMYTEAVCDPDGGEQELRSTDPHVMEQPCLWAILDYSSEIEMYAGWVEGDIEARRRGR